MNTAELKILRTAFEKLTAGKTLEDRAEQLTYNITQQLLRAERTVARKGYLDDVSRKFLIEDIEELQVLLSIPKNGEAG